MARNNSQNAANRAIRLMLEGLCVSCAKPATSKRYCSGHLKLQSILEAKRRQRNKKLVFTRYGGFVCSCCVETTKQFLTIDHMTGGGNSHRKIIGRGSNALYKWIIKNNYPSEFQVLCFNCNSGRYLNGGICPHGTMELKCVKYYMY